MSEHEVSILHPNPEDFVFRFKGKAYPVLKGIFFCYSKKFAVTPELQAQSEFVANFDVSEDSFRVFIDACQGKSFKIPRESIFDLEFLANYWGVSDLKAKINDIIKDDKSGKLRFESTVYKVQHKLGTEADENALADNIELYIDDERLPQFPIDVLRRVLYNKSFASIEPTKKYEFLKKVLKFHGKQGASLFADLVKGPVDEDEVEDLLKNKFVLQPLTLNLARSHFREAKRISSLDGIANDLNNAVRAIINNLDHNDVNKHVHGLDFHEAVQALENAAYLGDWRSEETLALIFSKGIGVPKNDEKAKEHAERAASLPKEIPVEADFLDSSNDVDFDLEPAIPLQRAEPPLLEGLSIPPSSPSNRGYGSGRHSRSTKKDKPKSVKGSRKVSIQRPSKSKNNAEPYENSRPGILKPKDQSSSDKPHKSESEKHESDRHSSAHEPIVQERDLSLDEGSEGKKHKKHSKKDHKKDSDSDRFLFEISPPRSKLHKKNLHEEGMYSEGNFDSEADKRIPIGSKGLHVKSYDVLMTPKGSKRKSMSSDSKAHLPYAIEDSTKIELGETMEESIAILEKKAGEGDVEAMFMLGVLFWDGTDVERNIEKSIKYYEQAIENGDTRSMFNLASLYDFAGEGIIPQNLSRAIELYTLAADKGEVCAQTNLGVIYETGTGVPQDYSKAVDLYERAAAQGDFDAELNLGYLYEAGHGVDKDLHKASQLFMNAAENGDPDAQNKLGVYYEQGLGGLPVDPEKAVSLYQSAAEQNNPDAQFNLANMYETGTGVEKDPKKVLEWYSKSAENGKREALFNLGALYQSGTDGIPQDLSKAYQYYQRAAKQGSPTALYNLGCMELYGEGTAKNIEQACKYFIQSSDLGFRDAQYYVATLYEDGEYLPRDIEQAIKLYTLASDQGHATAQYNLGLLYSESDAIPRDKEKARYYLTLAAEQGDSEARAKLEQLD